MHFTPPLPLESPLTTPPHFSFSYIISPIGIHRFFYIPLTAILIFHILLDYMNLLQMILHQSPPPFYTCSNLTVSVGL